MGRPSAEAGMIRQPLIIQMSALPIELPALCQLTEFLHVYQRAIVLLSRIRLSVHTVYVLLMGSYPLIYFYRLVYPRVPTHLK